MTDTETPAAPKTLTIQRLSDDEIRQFVLDVLGNRVFTSYHIPESDNRMLLSVFMALAFGAFKDIPRAELDQIGGIWEYMTEAGPLAVNGYPNFFSMHLMHIDDWNRAWEAIAKEIDRQKTLAV